MTAPYNLTMVTATAEKSIGNLVCLTNKMASCLPAYIILILTFAITLTVLLQKGKTLYTVMPVSFFGVSILSTIMIAIRCDGSGMVPLWLVFTLWGFTAVFTSLRVIIHK